MAVPRIGLVWCPHWPAVAAGVQPGEPVAVLHANRVVACSPAATTDGITIGMRRRPAQARCPSVRIVAHDPARDARAFEAIARAVCDLVSRLEVAEPGTLAFAARGPSRYFGGDPAMAERIAHVVTGALGPLADPTCTSAAPVGVGIGDGRFAAAVAARHASDTCHDGRSAALVVPPGRSARFLARFPIGLLHSVAGLPIEMVDVWIRLGIRSLGDLAALPAPDVLARFGQPGAFAHRIAGGGDDRPPGSVDPSPEWSLVRPFDDPVQQLDVLVFVAKQMATELVERLTEAGKVCTRLVVRAETEHGEHSERCWYRPGGLSAPAIVERVRWQLDGWVAQPGGITGGVTVLFLEPAEVRGDDGTQLGFWGGRTQADEWASRAVARVCGLAGEQHVLVPAWRGGRLPADAYSWEPAALSDLADSGDRLAVATVPWPGQIPAPSPAIVHPQPPPAEVRDATGAVVQVSGRGVVSAAPASVTIDGARDDVVAWAGPWPIDERWWHPDRHRRAARFQLLTANDEAYLAVVERGSWWIIGTYA